MHNETSTEQAKQASHLDTLFNQFQSQLERMQENNKRLRGTTNRMELDTPKESPKDEVKATAKFGEGKLTAIDTFISQLRDYNNEYDWLLTRLEKMI